MGTAVLSYRICLVVTLLVSGIWGCSMLATRPVQEMSDTSAAIKAAREVQADTKEPELYRQAMEWYSKARQEYRLKNFQLALEYAKKARSFAEQAEFNAVSMGASREEVRDSSSPRGVTTEPTPSPYPYPTPEGIPSEAYEEEQKKKEEEARKNSPSPSGVPAPTLPSSTPNSK